MKSGRLYCVSRFSSLPERDSEMIDIGSKIAIARGGGYNSDEHYYVEVTVADNGYDILSHMGAVFPELQRRRLPADERLAAMPVFRLAKI